MRYRGELRQHVDAGRELRELAGCWKPGCRVQHCGRFGRGSSVADSRDGQLPGLAADDAFEQFVRGRSAHLFRLALVLTGWDRGAAEDVLQIALERAYRRRRQLFRHGSAEPYVRKVVVNAAIDWQRIRRRRAEQPLDLAAGLAAADRTGQVADRDVLLRALAALAPRQRAVLVLRYWEDIPDAEIAAALNCSAATVRSQAFRGLARLRELGGGPPAARSENSARGGNHD
jgi:RNA polymerase sigma-70 factor (sigma-E family)